MSDDRDMTGTDPLGLGPPDTVPAMLPTEWRPEELRPANKQIHPLPVAREAPAIIRRQRPRMGLRFTVG